MKKHIRESYPGTSVCPNYKEGDELVEAAMHSDCDDCRAALMIAPTNERGCGVTMAPDYVPKPYANMETLEEIRARRNGR